MSDDDVLSKMDALLKRHQPDTTPHTEVPTLTQVVEAVKAAEPAAASIPVLTEILVPGATEAAPAEPLASQQSSAESPAPAEAFAAPPATHPAVDPKLLERMVAEKVNDWLEKSMPEKLAQLDVYAEDLVQDLVTQEIVKHMELLARDMTKLVQDEIQKALASLPLEHGKPPK